jgi:ferredoxin
VQGVEGQHLLEIAHRHGIDMEGACEASLACSTCHVVLDVAVYDALPAPQEKEEDLLDLAPGLCLTCVSLFPRLLMMLFYAFLPHVGRVERSPLLSRVECWNRFASHRSSRLGCQVIVTSELSGMKVHHELKHTLSLLMHV